MNVSAILMLSSPLHTADLIVPRYLLFFSDQDPALSSVLGEGVDLQNRELHAATAAITTNSRGISLTF
jgi:hypothetical protein